MPAETATYRPIARIFHWAMAALILALIPAGFVMVQEGLQPAIQNTLFVLHKNAGLLVLVAVLARLVYRAVNPAPPLPPTVSGVQRRAAALSHGALYALMILMPVLGYVRVKAGGFPIESLDEWGIPALVARSDALAATAKFAHFAGALALTALVSLHITAALYHALVLRDGVFARMAFGRSPKRGADI